MIADFAGSRVGVLAFFIAAFLYFIFWKGGRMISREMAERDLILRGFLDKPGDDDFAAHMRNYFVWHKFGFRTEQYYAYFDDDEKFYRYFRKQLYPPFFIAPVLTAALALVWMTLLLWGGAGTLLRDLDKPLSEVLQNLGNDAFFLLFALAPLFLLPVWKAMRERYRLVRGMDRRYRRVRDAKEGGPDAQALPD